MPADYVGDIRVGRDWRGRPSVDADDVFGALGRARETGKYDPLRKMAAAYAEGRVGIHSDESGAASDRAIELLANPHRWSEGYDW